MVGQKSQFFSQCAHSARTGLLQQDGRSYPCGTQCTPGLAIGHVRACGNDEVREADTSLLHELRVFLRLLSAHHDSGSPRTLGNTNVEGVRLLVVGSLRLRPKDLGVDGDVVRQQMLRNQNLTSSNSSGATRVGRLVLVFARNSVRSFGHVVTKERDVDSAVRERLLGWCFLTMGKFRASDLPFDLEAVRLLAGPRNGFPKLDTKAGVSIRAFRQPFVDFVDRFLCGMGSVGDGKVDESGSLWTPESHWQVFILERGWRVVPVEELQVTAISEDDQFVTRCLAFVIASRSDGEVVGNPAGKVVEELVIDEENDVIVLRGSHVEIRK
jgi:hypothetical protein